MKTVFHMWDRGQASMTCEVAHQPGSEPDYPWVGSRGEPRDCGQRLVRGQTAAVSCCLLLDDENGA